MPHRSLRFKALNGIATVMDRKPSGARFVHIIKKMRMSITDSQFIFYCCCGQASTMQFKVTIVTQFIWTFCSICFITAFIT